MATADVITVPIRADLTPLLGAIDAIVTALLDARAVLEAEIRVLQDT